MQVDMFLDKPTDAEVLVTKTLVVVYLHETAGSDNVAHLFIPGDRIADKVRFWDDFSKDVARKIREGYRHVNE